MEKFYFNTADMSKSWFLNNKDVTRIEKYPHCQFQDKEMAEKVKALVPGMEYGIVSLEHRERVSYLYSCCTGNWNAQLPYALFSLVISGKDHTKAKVYDTFVIGVSDRLGNTETLKKRAFENLQTLLMREGIGCLKKEAIDNLVLVKTMSRNEHGVI